MTAAEKKKELLKTFGNNVGYSVACCVEVMRAISKQNKGYDFDEALEFWSDVQLELEKSEKPIAEFCVEFCEIFPAVKLPTGKFFKSHPKDVCDKLKAFIKMYGYPQDVILQAARNYVDHAESVNYEYVRTSSYFIHKKGEGSDLASYCEDIVNCEKTTTNPLHKLI